MVTVKDLLDLSEEHYDKILKISSFKKCYALEHLDCDVVIKNIDESYNTSEGFSVQPYSGDYYTSLKGLIKFISSNDIPSDEKLFTWDTDDFGLYQLDMTILDNIILFTTEEQVIYHK